jgi:hypothetical protein
MKNPHVGQRVWAEKLTGTFVILAIDDDHVTADIQSTNSPEFIERRVAAPAPCIRWGRQPNLQRLIL